MDCTRSITFTIPGIHGAPDVQVTAVEVDGTIEFTVEVLTGGGITADLRGLFFDLQDDGKTAGLGAIGPDVTDFDTGDVIDLGQGANMRGAASPFDVGVEFGTPGKGKDDIQVATFTLSSTSHDLTLDDIAHVEFGARLTSVGPIGGGRNGSSKQVVLAPAAPDAVDDSHDIFEDGQDGLDDPSAVSEGVLFEVLDNDTDADGDTLTITSVHGAAHGTVYIVDGDDADTLPGDALLYVPDTDYAGTDAFTYCISDGNGGTDFATVSVAIAAVADVPDVSIQAFATSNVNEVRLVVTATQTDDDASEFINNLVASSLPAGVTLVPAGALVTGGTQVVQEYLLTLPMDQDADFDLTFTATAEELSNGDTETGSATIDIVYDYNTTTTAMTFDAEDQSIWSSGDAFHFVDDRFIGIDTGNFNESTGEGPFFAGISGHIQIGFQSTLEFSGGSIDATAEYDVTVETNYNRTIDTLLIETGSVLTDAFFNTVGPAGSYSLDFIWDILLDAYVGVDISFGELGSLTETANFPAVDIGPGSISILDLDSDDLGGTITLPPPADAFSVDFAWPNISTTGSAPPLDPVTSSGASNNFLQLNLDLDQLVTRLAGLPVNPFNPEISTGPFYAGVDLLNIYLTAGMNFLQEFEMDMGELVGILTFEDGSATAFEIGDSLQIANASAIDAAGDGDGEVDFQFTLIPESELGNLTQLGFNIGGGIDVLSAYAGYDIFGFTDQVEIGPLAGFNLTFPVGAIDVFDETFDLAFDAEVMNAYA